MKRHLFYSSNYLFKKGPADSLYYLSMFSDDLKKYIHMKMNQNDCVMKDLPRVFICCYTLVLGMVPETRRYGK